MSLYQSREENGRLFWGDDRLELVFDRASGRWLAMRDLATGSIRVLHHGASRAPGPRVKRPPPQQRRAHRRLLGGYSNIGALKTISRCGYECARSDRGATLTLHTEEGDWLLDQRYTLVKAAARVERGLRIEYRGESPALLRDVELRVPPAALGPVGECFAEAPCCPTKAHQPLAHLPVGEYWDRVIAPVGNAAPGWFPGLLGIDNPSRELALGVWVFTEDETADLRVMRGDHGTQIGHAVILADRFGPGHAIEWQGQYLQVFHKQWLEALKDFQLWYDEIGYQATPDRPEWARKARIYELFVGYAPERSVNRFPEMDTLAATCRGSRDWASTR